MEDKIKRVRTGMMKAESYVTQKRIMESFNHYVDDLIINIRKITDENPDPQMAANKTKRIIDYWFSHGGKLKKL